MQPDVRGDRTPLGGDDAGMEPIVGPEQHRDRQPFLRQNLRDEQPLLVPQSSQRPVEAVTVLTVCGDPDHLAVGQQRLESLRGLLGETLPRLSVPSQLRRIDVEQPDPDGVPLPESAPGLGYEPDRIAVDDAVDEDGSGVSRDA